MGMVKGFIQEFKEFISRGSVVDMAVGVIVGTAFKGIIDSLVNDIIMPVISRLIGGLDFSEWFIPLDGNTYPTLAAAKNVGAATLNYGSFITVIINFLLMALVIFTMIKIMNVAAKKLHFKSEEEAAPTTKKCPFCKSEIAIEATRCPHCTSEVPLEPVE
ncbi:MAG: large conductance mechanosensitive channel protein MscL [Bacillota bacterium]|nr:large conductance mechanosensitive channel protein MscL [Bacillota bacterium]